MENEIIKKVKDQIKERLKGEFTPLFLENGKPANVGYSSKTNVVYKDEDQLINQYWKSVATEEEGKIIREQESIQFQERCAVQEKAKFDKAEKIKFSEFKGQTTLFFSEHYGGGSEGYFDELEMLFDSIIEDVGFDYDLWPTYIWSTRKVPLISKKHAFDDVYEHDLEETFEGSEHHIEGVKDLQKALDGFVEANKDNCAYWPDYSTALLIGDQIEEFKKNYED